MKYLLVYAHPEPGSLNGQLKTFLEQHLRESGHEVTVRDLYGNGFDPVLSVADIQGQRRGEAVAADVQAEQAHITWADCLVFIHPIWWTGLPAMMKGYIDRVFSYGFAYRYEQGVQEGLLAGKQAVIINTHGKSHEEYVANGLGAALSLTSDKGIYTYCGLEVRQHIFLDRADRATPDAVAQWKEQLRSAF